MIFPFWYGFVKFEEMSQRSYYDTDDDEEDDSGITEHIEETGVSGEEGTRKVVIGRRMFVEDAPITVPNLLPVDLVNQVKGFVENNLFPKCKFYWDDNDVDNVVGYVMHLCGYGGATESDRKARMKMWVAVRTLIWRRTNELRQLVCDRWFKVAGGKLLFLVGLLYDAWEDEAEQLIFLPIVPFPLSVFGKTREVAATIGDSGNLQEILGCQSSRAGSVWRGIGKVTLVYE